VLAVNVSRNSFDRKRLEGLVPPEWLDVSERGWEGGRTRPLLGNMDHRRDVNKYFTSSSLLSSYPSSLLFLAPDVPKDAGANGFHAPPGPPAGQ